MGYHSMDYLRFDCNMIIASKSTSAMKKIAAVKSEITHTLGRHQILWVIKGYGLLQVNPVCVIRVGGLKMLWIITDYGLSQYGLSQV